MNNNFEAIHIVIVEDDQYSVDILGNLLSGFRIPYTSMTNGEQIISALKRFSRTDVIFLDLELPKLDGYSVFQIIRAEESFNHIPIIAYTSHTNEMAVTRQKGFQGFLSKPLQGNEFPAQLDRILNGESVWE
jgi:two-component system cell cycle response regulator DivK